MGTSHGSSLKTGRPGHVKIALDVTAVDIDLLFFSSQHVASLYTEMLLLELIPGAMRPSTEINNNYFFYSTSTMIIYDRFSL